MLLIISTLRYPSFKNVAVGKGNPRILIIALALVVTLIWFYSRWVLLIMACSYALNGIVAKLWSLVRPRHADRAELEIDRKQSSHD